MEVRTEKGTTRGEGGDGSDEVTAPGVEGAESTRSPVQRPPVEGGPVDIDQVFEILKNQRRRYALRYLDAVDEQVTLSDLAERIAAWESGKEVGQITSQERKRVYVGLYQCHLPKMDDIAAISYNKERGRIELGENAALFIHYLPDETDPVGGGTDGGDDEKWHWRSLLETVLDRFR